MKSKPYILYIDDMEIPVTPAEIKTEQKSKNDFYSLINGNTFTALRKPALKEWSFDFYAFSKRHPFVETFISQDVIKEKLDTLKKEKRVFQFIVLRATSDVSLKNSFCFYMTLEDYSIRESADIGTNIIISLKLKEYQPIRTVKLKEASSKNEVSQNAQQKESRILYRVQEAINPNKGALIDLSFGVVK